MLRCPMPFFLMKIHPSLQASARPSTSAKHLSAPRRGESEPSRRCRPRVGPPSIVVVHSLQTPVSNCSRVAIINLNETCSNDKSAPLFHLFRAQNVTSNGALAAKKCTNCTVQLSAHRSWDPSGPTSSPRSAAPTTSHTFPSAIASFFILL